MENAYPYTLPAVAGATRRIMLRCTGCTKSPRIHGYKLITVILFNEMLKVDLDDAIAKTQRIPKCFPWRII